MKVEIELDLQPQGTIEMTVEELESGEIWEFEAENAEKAQELVEANI